jgi:dihydrolipoamide dehydrogenase
VQNGLTADQVASSYTVYPSMTGSVAEAARMALPSSRHG